MSGKKFTDSVKTFDRDQLFTPTEAVTLVKSLAKATFDESVEIAVRLGVDPRKADQMVRGTVALPEGTGKNVRVAVFASGEAAQEARDAGADIVGADDLAEEIQKGKMDFDLAIATPDMMPLVGRLGRVLGPAWPDAEPEDRHRHPGRRPRRRRVQGRQGRVPHRPLRQRARHHRQGQLRARRRWRRNFRAVLDELQRAKPASAKGRYLRKISVSSTMGPGIKVDTNRLRPEVGHPDFKQ